MASAAKALFATAGVLAGVVAVGYVSVRNMGGAPGAAIVPAAHNADALVQRGAYLLTVLDCNACHTPHDERGQPIMAMALTGHPAEAPLPEWDPSLLERNILATIAPTLTAYAGPFGVSVAPNLTPDPETGTGGMTAEDLIRSWRTGQHWREGRAVLPPMPVPAYSGLTDDDIRAVHAYLMSLKPVKNRAPASRPARP